MLQQLLRREHQALARFFEAIVSQEGNLVHSKKREAHEAAEVPVVDDALILGVILACCPTLNFTLRRRPKYGPPVLRSETTTGAEKKV